MVVIMKGVFHELVGVDVRGGLKSICFLSKMRSSVGSLAASNTDLTAEFDVAALEVILDACVLSWPP